jgi:hypothetical protein
LKLFEAPKVPEITQTYPTGQREGYEKYSSLASAAIRSSCKAIHEGGGLVCDKAQLEVVDDAVADLALRLLIRESLQRKQRTNHVFTYFFRWKQRVTDVLSAFGGIRETNITAMLGYFIELNLHVHINLA